METSTDISVHSIDEEVLKRGVGPGQRAWHIHLVEGEFWGRTYPSSHSSISGMPCVRITTNSCGHYGPTSFLEVKLILPFRKVAVRYCYTGSQTEQKHHKAGNNTPTISDRKGKNHCSQFQMPTAN